MARGVMGDDNPLLIGMLGMHGSYASNMAMSESDLIISLGARFDDRVTGKLSEFAKYADIIHVDIDPTSISKNIHAHIPVVGSIEVVLDQLLEQLRDTDEPEEDSESRKKANKKWWHQIDCWR
ncbi:MAG: hypothetical protein L3J46_08575 [Kangiellaceae bacterium]|nr:hypothetical protein [Kangiellaceae bacterium]